MSTIRLLIVEDNEQERSTCRDSVIRYKDEKQHDIVLVECKDLDEAINKLDNSFDGAIIDLNLDNQGNGGNQVINQIDKLHLRIPVAILTGTPDPVDMDLSFIGVFIKGEPGSEYIDLFDKFLEIHNTGITRIMGGRGKIEETLSYVFQKNLMPEKNRNKWVEYGQLDPTRTEKALLRHALNHLLQLLDDDDDRCFPEEVYIAPPISDKIRTGSMIKKKSCDKWFVVMNPACDLVIRRNGKFKTDRILYVEVENEMDVVIQSINEITKADKKEKKLKAVYGNNHNVYHHWLPKTNFFPGGFLNFRKITSCTPEEHKSKFEKPEIQISPPFVKDIVARFSSYYARQGQPDIDSDNIIASLMDYTKNVK